MANGGSDLTKDHGRFNCRQNWLVQVLLGPIGAKPKIEMQVNRMAVLESSLMLSVVSAFADGRRQTEMIKFEAFKTGEDRKSVV